MERPSSDYGHDCPRDDCTEWRASRIGLELHLARGHEPITEIRRA
ncbi:hypothetical protein [Haloarchaeobius salinus]|nr:hypothetical protein [Haloarchaeobius salinus]